MARFKKGESGNPAGRPPGRGTATQLREAIGKELPAIVQVLVEQARAGDVQAARALLDKALPNLRPVEQTQALALPDGSLTEQGRAVLAAVAGGELGPAQGAQLVAAIGQLARVVEIDELQRRIERLEESTNGDS
ncbi:MAG: hypothetical protein JSS31_18915 [Proteobacteria bacterium]|nr:hypothetical protein [Pseudomonadota bacterium]